MLWSHSGSASDHTNTPGPRLWFLRCFSTPGLLTILHISILKDFCMQISSHIRWWIVEIVFTISAPRRTRCFVPHPVCLWTPPVGGSGSPGTAWLLRRPAAPGAETSVPSWSLNSPWNQSSRRRDEDMMNFTARPGSSWEQNSQLSVITVSLLIPTFHWKFETQYDLFFSLLLCVQQDSTRK